MDTNFLKFDYRWKIGGKDNFLCEMEEKIVNYDLEKYKLTNNV